MLNRIDLRKVLKHPVIYTTYQKIVGGYRARKLFVENNVKVKPNEHILDIGCGPGDILDFLPNVNYTGIDQDLDYIKRAKKKYGKKGIFKCIGVDELNSIEDNKYDIVIASGVLHHLTDDQCYKLFEIAKKALKPNGRFVSFDGCYIPNQNKISKYFLRKDRGQYVRTKHEYVRLAQYYFKYLECYIDESYFYIPYTSIIMECKNNKD